MKAVEDNKNFKFIVGSEGGMDYLVVAINKDVCLGVKPVLGAIPPVTPGGSVQLFVGARIRAARMQEQPNSVVEIGNLTAISSPLGFQEAFPDIQFQKVNKQRASTELGVLLPFTPWIKGSTTESIQKVQYHQKLAEFLMKNVPEGGSFAVEPDEFMQFIKDRYNANIIDIEKQFPQTTGDVDADMQLDQPKSLFSKMIDPEKFKQDKITKSGLKVVDTEPNQEPSPQDISDKSDAWNSNSDDKPNT